MGLETSSQLHVAPAQLPYLSSGTVTGLLETLYTRTYIIKREVSVDRKQFEMLKYLTI